MPNVNEIDVDVKLRELVACPDCGGTCVAIGQEGVWIAGVHEP